MQARFTGQCGRCGESYPVGTEVVKDAASGRWGHAQCQAGAPATRRTSAPRRASEPRRLGEGEVEVTRPSQGRDDSYGVGDVAYYTRIATLGGPDGHYGVVVREGRSRDVDSDEWVLWAHVRPATAEESAPVAARREAKARREALLTQLRGLWTPAMLTEAPLHSGRRLVLHQTVAGHAAYVLAEDGSVWRTESSYDDAPRAWRTTDAAAAEALRELLSMEGH